MKKTPLEKYVEDVMNKRASILDHFARAYLASMKKLSARKVMNLELVEITSTDGTTVRWFFRNRRTPKYFN